jgi:hypothetical protein
MANNYYCASSQCRRTTQRLRVEMAQKTYYYCVECGRRLERKEAHETHAHEPPRNGPTAH